MKTSKIILMVLVLSFISCSINSQYISSLKLKQDITKDSTQKVLSEKSPLLAGTLSFIVPGLALGQFYNGQILKGMMHVAISGLGFVLFMSGFDVGGGTSNHGTAIAGFVIYLGNWIFTTFEAIGAAEEINKQVRLQKYRSDLINKFRLGLVMNKNGQFNLKFVLDL